MLVVAALNFGYFWVEAGVALAIGSVALLADGVDFLEDTAVNLLIALALAWPLHRRALAGKAMAAILLVPAAVALAQAVAKVRHPQAPDPRALVLVSLGAVLVNGISAWLLARRQLHAGSLSRAAFLSARNDVIVNLAIIAMAGVTVVTASGWPDVLLGLGILALNGRAAFQVWELSEQERLAARALAGEDLD